MQPADTLDLVIRDGIRFLESITHHYGTDRGMEIWEGIGGVVGKEIKGKIFFAMISGETGSRVSFSTGKCDQIVSAIKAIRTATGYGLKEAKDKYDESRINTVIVECIDTRAARELSVALRGLGCLV